MWPRKRSQIEVFVRFRRDFGRKRPRIFFEIIVFIAAIDSVKFSSKSELSSRFFGRLKFSVLFEYLGLQNLTSFFDQYQKNNGSVRAIYSNSAENFKRPKNREDGSDLDEKLTESIAAMKTIISKKFVGRFPPKPSRNVRETVVDGVGGRVAGAVAPKKY